MKDSSTRANVIVVSSDHMNRRLAFSVLHPICNVTIICNVRMGLEDLTRNGDEFQVAVIDVESVVKTGDEFLVAFLAESPIPTIFVRPAILPNELKNVKLGAPEQVVLSLPFGAVELSSAVEKLCRQVTAIAS